MACDHADYEVARLPDRNWAVGAWCGCGASAEIECDRFERLLTDPRAALRAAHGPAPTPAPDPRPAPRAGRSWDLL